MKKKRILVAMFFALNLFPAFAMSGQDRGGGKSIVCRDSQNQIQSVELLDLWEARNLRGKTIVPSSGDVQQDMDQALKRAKFIFSREDERVDEALKFVSQSILDCTNKKPQKCTFGNVEKVTGMDLPISDDSFEGNLSLPPGCKVEQSVTFDHRQARPLWTLNMDLIEKMDAINLVALSLHEGVYGLLDTYDGEKNSQRVRRIVGHVMSGGTFSVLADQVKRPYVHCKGSVFVGVNEFYFMQDPKLDSSKVILLAEGFAGNQLIGFNDTSITSEDILTNVNVEAFYERLTRGNIKMQIQGATDGIEFLSVLRFEINSGSGALYLDAFTGGGLKYAPIENVNCGLVK